MSSVMGKRIAEATVLELEIALHEKRLSENNTRIAEIDAAMELLDKVGKQRLELRERVMKLRFFHEHCPNRAKHTDDLGHGCRYCGGA